jgi:hypothetical protein
MTEYVLGSGTREQQRLVEQAEHWRSRLIRDGTTLAAGARSDAGLGRTVHTSTAVR